MKATLGGRRESPRRSVLTTVPLTERHLVAGRRPRKDTSKPVYGETKRAVTQGGDDLLKTL